MKSSMLTKLFTNDSSDKSEETISTTISFFDTTPFEDTCLTKLSLPSEKNSIEASCSNFPSSLNEDETKLLWDLAMRFKKDWKRIAIEFERIFNKPYDREVLRLKYREFPVPKSRGIKFSAKDDDKLIDLIRVYGFDWVAISREFPERCPLSLRNRYYTISKSKNLGDLRKKSDEIPLNVLVKDLVLDFQPPFLKLIDSLMLEVKTF